MNEDTQTPDQVTSEDIDQKINDAQQTATYGVSLIPYHTHNGTDSPKLDLPKVYGGTFNSSGVKGTFFPSGWSVSRTAAGRYQVTHKLKTANFTVVCTPVNAVAVYVPSITSTTFNIYATTFAGAFNDIGINFVVIA